MEVSKIQNRHHISLLTTKWMCLNVSTLPSTIPLHHALTLQQEKEPSRSLTPVARCSSLSWKLWDGPNKLKSFSYSSGSCATSAAVRLRTRNCQHLCFWDRSFCTPGLHHRTTLHECEMPRPLACGLCQCNSFEPNPFRPQFCRVCFHVHRGWQQCLYSLDLRWKLEVLSPASCFIPWNQPITGG